MTLIENQHNSTMKFSVCHLLLPPLLVLFNCHCLAAVHEKVGAVNQYSIFNRSNRFKALRSGLNVNKERPTDHFLTINSSRADLPCPDSAAIAPCTCTVDTNNRTYLDCTYVESIDQLVEVFQQDFPVKELYQFTMANNNAIYGFSSFMNGITFESVYLSPGPFILAGISDHFLFDQKDTLKEFFILNSKLTTDFFPFFMLPSMNQLESLSIHFSNISWIPQIQSPNLTLFGLENSPFELLESGTFAIGPGPMHIYVNANQIHTVEVGSIFFADQDSADSNAFMGIELQFNQLQSLVAGTFPLRNGQVILNLFFNNISYIEPGTFVLPASTDLLAVHLDLDYNALTTFDEAVFGSLMPFVTYLGLHTNPLTCGCDIAWLILNGDFLATVDEFARCVDGTNLHDLDPQQYIDFC